MLVSARMSPNPITITPETSISDAMRRMQRENVRRFPVVDKNGKLIGLVSHTDLLYASPSSVTSLNMWEVTYLLSQIKVKDVMTKKVHSIPEDTPIEEAARVMVDNKIGALPVTRDDKVVGIITESDLFKVFLEIFGAREVGIRVTLLAPYVKGSMAKITSAITSAGGLILSFDTFLADDPSKWGCTLKVSDVTKETLLEVLEPLIDEITDVREA